MTAWNRKLWGVQFIAVDERPMLIGWLWMRKPGNRAFYDGEPTRALLFTTRKDAREFCRTEHEKYADREKHDICSRWRFKPVRVRETVRVIKD